MTQVQAPAFDSQPASATLVDFVREVCRRTGGTLPRARILAALEGFDETYRTRDFAQRCSYFAQELVFEDPAGLPRASNQSELLDFFVGTIASGLTLIRRIEERIIINDEAIERVMLEMGAEGQAPAYLSHYIHYTFDEAGLIKSMRVFFDGESVSAEAR